MMVFGTCVVIGEAVMGGQLLDTHGTFSQQDLTKD